MVEVYGTRKAVDVGETLKRVNAVTRPREQRGQRLSHRAEADDRDVGVEGIRAAVGRDRHARAPVATELVTGRARI